MHWEKKKDKTTYYIRIDHFQIIVGEHQGSGHTDNAGVASYADFLAGHFQSDIRRVFGENVLDEVIAAVKSADDDPVFAKKRSAERSLLETLNGIPLDATLAGLLQDPPTERGALNYGNGGGYKTILKSDTLTLTFERDKGILTPNVGGDPITVTLPGHGSDAVTLNDHFYIIVSDDLVVVKPNGEIIKERGSLFGETLRITTVNRHEDVIYIAYRWFFGNHPRGWLRYEVDKGFTGRWVKIKGG